MSLTDLFLAWCAVSCLLSPAVGLFIATGMKNHAR